MKHKSSLKFSLLLMLLMLFIVLTGCGDDSAATDGNGTRDNSPKVLIGSADGATTYGNSDVTIDASHVDCGYIMVNYSGSGNKIKLQLTGPNGITYTYDLHGDWESFPLTAGNGNYNVSIFKNIQGTSYSSVYSQGINVSISDSLSPFLYASQYVDFNADSPAIDKAQELAASADEDIQVVESIYNYVIDNYKYDYDKADSVESGYLPNVDEIFKSEKGICFDYAAVMATMLRTQGIPTRLEVGYAGDIYHAWITVYIEGKGWVNGIIEFDGTDWTMMDPTFASTSKDPEDFIPEQSDYSVKYVY